MLDEREYMRSGDDFLAKCKKNDNVLPPGSTNMALLCPHCLKRVTVLNDKSGQVINCPMCNGVFAVPLPRPQPPVFLETMCGGLYHASAACPGRAMRHAQAQEDKKEDTGHLVEPSASRESSEPLPIMSKNDNMTNNSSDHRGGCCLVVVVVVVLMVIGGIVKLKSELAHTDTAISSQKSEPQKSEAAVAVSKGETKIIHPHTPTEEIFASYDAFNEEVAKFEERRKKTSNKCFAVLAGATVKLSQSSSNLRSVALEFEGGWKTTGELVNDLKKQLSISESAAVTMFDKWDRNNIYANQTTQQAETQRINTTKKQWEQLSHAARADIANLDLQIIAGHDLQKRLVSAYIGRDIEVKIAEFEIVLGLSKDIFEHLQKFTEKSNNLIPTP